MEIPNGVYHYDAAHHRLLLIREGQFDSYLARSLGNRCDVSAYFGVVFVSTMFWKNFYKYHNFAYRLQGLDTGIVIGQLLEVAKRFGFTSEVYFQFLDQAVNHLIGLSKLEESVNAVIPLSAETNRTRFAAGLNGREAHTASELCQELPAIRHEQVMRSRKIKDYSMLIQINESSMLQTTERFRNSGQVNHGDSKHGDSEHGDTGIRAVYLPRVSRIAYDLASALKNRYSPETEFVMGKVTGRELAVLLQEATASLDDRNDLLGSLERPEARVFLYVCLYQVEGVPDGAYRYDLSTHALRSILPGNHWFRLQQAMHLNNMNLSQVPICFHVAGDLHFLNPQFGPRGYRMLQMEAGMLVQRLLLAASALGMGGRPLLGFKARHCDEIYGLNQHGKTCLIQLPIGFYRHRPSLEGGLHG
jgi:SagB-type dehydrogenase family enzyme